MALGDILRKARESRKLTASQVASATHMKVQTVEAIEREDFSRMPAAIYCKGFIKLYAEYMGLNPDPLTREYVERFVDPPPPPEPEEPEKEPGIFHMGFNKKEDLPPIAQEEKEDDDHPDLFAYGANRTEEPPEKLFDHTPPAKEKEPKPEQKRPSIGEGLASIFSKLTGAVSNIKKKLAEARAARQNKAPEPGEPVEEIAVGTSPAVDVSPITLPNRQILIISGAVAGVILLVFLFSVAARFFSGDDNTYVPPDDQELVLPVDPPAPYID